MHVLCNGKEFKGQSKTLTYPRVDGDPRWAFQPSNQSYRYLGLFLLLDLTSANNTFQNSHNHKRGSVKKKTQLITHKQREVYSLFGFQTSSARRNCPARCVARKPYDQMHHQTKYRGRANSIEKYAIANIHSMGNPSSNVHEECPDSIFFYFC